MVSVIVPFYNARRFLAAALDSVRGQRYPDWELLLVDDGSTDDSAAIACTVAASLGPRCRLLRHPGGANRGAAASRNLGLRHARGAYVAFLDADDAWLPHKLSEQVALLDAQPHLAAVAGRLIWVSEGRVEVPPLMLAADTVLQPPSGLWLCYPLGRGAAPAPSDMLVRTAVARAVGGFEEHFVGPLQLFEDQAFMAKLYARHAVLRSSRCWTRYREHADACSARHHRHFRRVREYYLRWLRGWLEREGVHDRRVRAALRRALLPGRLRRGAAVAAAGLGALLLGRWLGTRWRG